MTSRYFELLHTFSRTLIQKGHTFWATLTALETTDDRAISMRHARCECYIIVTDNPAVPLRRVHTGVAVCLSLPLFSFPYSDVIMIIISCSQPVQPTAYIRLYILFSGLYKHHFTKNGSIQVSRNNTETTTQMKYEQ